MRLSFPLVGLRSLTTRSAIALDRSPRLYDRADALDERGRASVRVLNHGEVAAEKAIIEDKPQAIMTHQLSPPIASLYEQDYCLWLDRTIQQLRDGEIDRLDVPALLEELQGMSNSEKNALESNLRILFLHLLKYRYQPRKRTNSWRFTIREHRKRILKAFDKSPSLKRYYGEVFAECYQDGRELASDETGLSLESFPENSPFTADNTLDTGYLPE